MTLMQRITRNIAGYLEDAFGGHAMLWRWEGARRLPLFLRDRYSFYEGRLFGDPLLFMVARRSEEETPKTISKHLEQTEAIFENPVVYVRDSITSYNRKRLIDHRIPFIVPRKHMYLLPLGIDFSEIYRPLEPEIEAFAPSTQAVLIYMLLQLDEMAATSASQLGPQLQYAPITLSRAFDELENAELAESRTVDRARQVCLTAPKRVIWDKALPMLRSPVQRLFHVRGEIQELHGLTAGVSALAQRSMLAEPNIPVIAADRDDWRSAQRSGVIERVPMRDIGVVDVEIWKYPPRILSEDETVDPLSLYLTLRGESDERVEMALEQMLETLPW